MDSNYLSCFLRIAFRRFSTRCYDQFMLDFDIILFLVHLTLCFVLIVDLIIWYIQFYIDPTNSYEFRSLKEVHLYLESQDTSDRVVTPNKRKIEDLQVSGNQSQHVCSFSYGISYLNFVYILNILCQLIIQLIK